MAKLETPAVLLAASRAPRPAMRMQAGVAAGESAVAQRRAADDDPEVVQVLELGDDEVDDDLPGDDLSGDDLHGDDLHGDDLHRAELAGDDPAGYGHAEAAEREAPVSDDVVTERGFDGSMFGLPRAAGTRLPLASLEMPSPSRLELTPSPVPRVALSPATGAVDISLVPGPHASRNLPTLAAHHVFGRRPARRPASAITFPPPRRAPAEAPRLGAGLAKDVRSSKREIVLGLAIGLGLSLVLAAVGQAYLREDPLAGAPTAVESVTLGARPGSEAVPGSEVPESVPMEGPTPEPIARAALAEPARGEPASVPAASGRVERELVPPLSSRAARPSARRVGVAPRAIPSRQRPRAESPEAVASVASPPAPKAARSHGAQPPAAQPPAAQPPAAVSPAGVLPAAVLPAAPLSPAESAGLGLDLDL